MRIFQKILPALLPFLLLSCRYKDPELLEYKVFDSLIFERKMTFDDMISDVMDQYGEHSSAYGELAELLEEGRQAAEDYTVYGITDNSLDHEGKPVKATGLVYYPETTYLKGVIEIVPVNKSKLSCGSVNRSVPEAIAGCTGYIMIVPDLLGCGGTEDYPISYVQHDDIVRLAADMRKAAYEFLYNHRYIRLGSKDYIFGYTVLNDVSARNIQMNHEQWYFGKSLDGFTPMGPCILTRDSIPYPPRLELKSFVNGELRQHSNTDRLIFDIDYVVSELSAGMTLRAGTIISMGTPSGVGFGFQPPKFMKAGDIVECRVEAIGSLINKVVDEDQDEQAWN